VQVKLLEDKTVRRLGSVREQRANIRIVTATNRDLGAAVHEGSFRADLLFRLRIVHFELPPLRVRGDDVLDLAEYYLNVHRRRYGKPHLHHLLPGWGKPQKGASVSITPHWDWGISPM
jgi:two-component system response regulator AtoC